MIEIVESSRLLGIAKQMNSELEKVPIQSAATILSMLNSLMQHRQVSEKLLSEAEVAEKNNAVHERQMALMEQEQARQAAAQLKQAQENLPKLVLTK